MKTKGIDLTEGSPGKGLLLFAFPVILGNLFQQFYNMVDTIIVGKYVGEDALAAVGASYALTTVFVMIAIGGGTGASVVISQYGNHHFPRDKHRAWHVRDIGKPAYFGSTFHTG